MPKLRDSNKGDSIDQHKVGAENDKPFLKMVLLKNDAHILGRTCE